MSEMRTITLEQFQREGAEKGFRMLCPACGNIATPQDFIKLGADPQSAATECIGRAMKPMAKFIQGEKPCNWAAYGLFRTLGKGMLVDMGDGKNPIEAFEFADPA